MMLAKAPSPPGNHVNVMLAKAPSPPGNHVNVMLASSRNKDDYFFFSITIILINLISRACEHHVYVIPRREVLQTEIIIHDRVNFVISIARACENHACMIPRRGRLFVVNHLIRRLI